MASTVSDCSSDALSLQNTPAHDFHDLPSADQDSQPTPLPNGCNHSPAIVKKRGRGRPPIYKLSDKRKAQLKKVSLCTFYMKVKKCFKISLSDVCLPPPV